MERAAIKGRVTGFTANHINRETTIEIVLKGQVLPLPSEMKQEVWLSVTEPAPVKIEKVAAFLTRHPAPWLVDREEPESGGSYACVVDKHRRVVFGTRDHDEYATSFTGHIDELVKTVNTLAEALEVKGEPRPATFNPGDTGQWVEADTEHLGRVRGILTKADEGWNDDGRQDCWVVVPGRAEPVKVVADNVTVLDNVPRVWRHDGQPGEELR